MLKDSDKNAGLFQPINLQVHEDWLSEYFSDPDEFWVTTLVLPGRFKMVCMLKSLMKLAITLLQGVEDAILTILIHVEATL